MSQVTRLPRFRPEHLPRTGSLEEYLNELVEAVERQLESIQQSAGRQKYDPTNITHTTAIDGATADLDTTRNVLGTLISDLKRRGDLG